MEDKKTHTVSVSVIVDGKEVFKDSSAISWPVSDGKGELPNREVRCEACKLVHRIQGMD